MNYTLQYLNIFGQFAVSASLILSLFSRNKELEKSMQETKELKEQVFLLLNKSNPK